MSIKSKLFWLWKKTIFFPGVRYRWKSWTIKKAECRRSDLFELWCWRMEKTLECALDCKEIHPVNPKGNQLWIFSARTDAEAPLLWPPDEKSQLIEKKENPDAGKYWRLEQEGWQRMRCLDGISNPMEWVWASFRRWWWAGKPGVLKFKGHRESDRTEQLNNKSQAGSLCTAGWTWIGLLRNSEGG